ncbi:aldehyde dehydrogenase, partial [Actinomadura sp. DSM 109109]|nr:aldehyde dehydrogenase [Actinomadura lepetitiana]NDU77874.1 aldehyde dehydrogenase [Actinomadura lepetitiana]
TELAPGLTAHMDVNAIDLTGIPDEHLRDLEDAAAGNLKRVFRPTGEDWTQEPGTARLTAFLETKTVWHPVGV